EMTVFDTKNKPNFTNLKSHDVILSFLPGEAFKQLIPLFVETKVSVVTASTGFSWPKDMNEVLKENKVAWIHASNFSLGIVIVKKLIESMRKLDHILDEKEYSIHEIHHTK